MIVNKCKFFSDETRGASIMEVLLALGIVALITPFVYEQIMRTTQNVRDMRYANDVIELRDTMVNFVRINQDQWPDNAQIRLDPAELAAISELPIAGFIDKYSVRGAAITDVYLAFDFSKNDLQASRIAKHIGGDAAVVADDGVAYGSTWAVAAPDFVPGDLIYRISRDVAGEDTSKYLHRGTSGEDDLNKMMRDFNMGGYNVYNVGTITAQSSKFRDVTTTYADLDSLQSTNVYFSSGANMDGGDVYMGGLRVSGDITGFRNIYADTLNGTTYTTSGRVIADRANVVGSVNVARDFILKSESLKTISGFTSLSASSVVAPYLSTEEIIFYEDFGLTVSGELLMSTMAPLQIGSWFFPSTTPPKFNSLKIKRTNFPAAPKKDEFKKLMGNGWRTAM